MLLGALLLAGCGYRPLGRTWPARLGRVQVVLPEAPQLGEPDLPRMIAVELVRQLGRAGVSASSGAAATRLQGRLLALETVDSPLDPDGRRVAARALRLRLELRLASVAEDRTLWRGPLEVEELWSMAPSGAALSEASRRRTLQRLAARAAALAVELLEAAPEPR